MHNEADFDNNTIVKSEGGAARPCKVYTLEEVDVKIRNLTGLPPMRDKAYFHDACSLHNMGTNPHCLQVKEYIPLSNLHGLFARGIGGPDSNTLTARMQM